MKYYLEVPEAVHKIFQSIAKARLSKISAETVATKTVIDTYIHLTQTRMKGDKNE